MSTWRMEISMQIIGLLILAIPIACVTWTMCFEEIFSEPRAYCVKRSQECRSLLKRKFFFLFTCEYCLSHYITILFLMLTGYKLLLIDWRGYIIAGFSLVWMANIYMNLFMLMRQGIKKEKTEIKVLQKKAD